MTNTNVPIALFVFNRASQLKKTLQGLKANHIDELYIFTDGPRNKADLAGVKEVRELLNKIDWIKPKVVIQEKNLGLSESIRFGLDKLFKDYEQVIVLEDDIYVAPDFYSYMKAGLSKYANDESVACITGLRYPFKSKALAGYKYDAFFTRRFCSWGWGTWRRFWQTVEFDPKKLDRKLKSGRFHLEEAGDDMPIMIRQLISGQVHGAWDINCGASLLSNRQRVVWPAFNMVINTGLLEGTHANGEAPPWELKWEQRKQKGGYKFPPSVIKNEELDRGFLKFFFYHLNPQASGLDELKWRLRHPIKRGLRKR